MKGKPLFAIYSYRWAGLNPSNGNPQGFLNGSVSSDYNAIISNSKIDSLVYHGSARPTVFGSLRNTVSYRGFSISANLIYKLNYYVRKTALSYTQLFNGSGHIDYPFRWRKPGDELYTNVPSAQYPPVTGNRDAFYQYAEVNVIKGDHIRIQDISISYEMQRSKIKFIPFSYVQFYLYVNNIGILWKANDADIDPDVFSNAGYMGAPAPKTFAAGLRCTF